MAVNTMVATAPLARTARGSSWVPTLTSSYLVIAYHGVLPPLTHFALRMTTMTSKGMIVPQTWKSPSAMLTASFLRLLHVGHFVKDTALKGTASKGTALKGTA